MRIISTYSNTMTRQKILLSDILPEYPEFVEGIRRAPDRGFSLTDEKTVTALKTLYVTSRNLFMRKWLPNFLRS